MMRYMGVFNVTWSHILFLVLWETWLLIWSKILSTFGHMICFLIFFIKCLSYRGSWLQTWFSRLDSRFEYWNSHWYEILFDLRLGRWFDSGLDFWFDRWLEFGFVGQLVSFLSICIAGILTWKSICSLTFSLSWVSTVYLVERATWFMTSLRNSSVIWHVMISWFFVMVVLLRHQGCWALGTSLNWRLTCTPTWSMTWS